MMDSNLIGTTSADLENVIDQIGLARFVGRINSGVIPANLGYEAVEHFVSREKERPALSRISQFLLGRPDSYGRKSP